MEYYDEEAVCACRKGIVVKYCGIDENDWDIKISILQNHLLMLPSQ